MQVTAPGQTVRFVDIDSGTAFISEVGGETAVSLKGCYLDHTGDEPENVYCGVILHPTSGYPDGPGIINRSVYADRPALAVSDLEIIMSDFPEDMVFDGSETSWRAPNGRIFLIDDNAYLKFRTGNKPSNTGYINLESGDIIFELSAQKPVVIKQWQLGKTVDGFFKDILDGALEEEEHS